MRTIIIDDYISNHDEALKAIRDFSHNKLIIKGSCGIGGTNAVLGITDQDIIIISPYIPRIKEFLVVPALARPTGRFSQTSSAIRRF